MFFFFGGLGLIIGSFLNVVISREGTEEGLGGRSHCPRCNHVLQVSDLVPVISWVLLRGRCRYCHASISLQYPMVELATMFLFFIVGISPLSIVYAIIALPIVALCVAIAVFDIKYMLIPDLWNYLFGALALVYGFVLVQEQQTSLILFLISGPLVTLPLWGLWAYSEGRWMGFGDVKLGVGIGWLLGFELGYTAVLGAFILGALVSVFVLLPLPYYVSLIRRFARLFFSLWGKLSLKSGAGFTMASEVPFGPFLIASCLIVWFLTMFGVDLSLLRI